MERNAAQNMMFKYLEHSLKYLEMAGGRKNEKWRLFLINKFQWFLGPNHSIVLAGFDNLAIFHLEQNNYSKSEKILKQLIKTRKSQMPVDHPQLAKTLTTLANNYSHQKKYKLAENSYMKALKIRANSHGAYHVEVAHIFLDMANL